MLVLGLTAALVAAAANAGAAMLEAMATRRATHAAGVVTSPLYLSGLALDIFGWVLTVLALRYMPIVAVQAIVSGQVVITVIASHWVFDTPLRRLDLIAAGANVVGLGLLVGSARTTELPHSWRRGDDRAAGRPGGARRGRDRHGRAQQAGGPDRVPRRAELRRHRGGGAPGATSTGRSGRSAHTVVTDPVAYALLGYAALGLGLYTVALARGAVGPVVAVLAVTETLAPGLLGLLFLGDGIRDGWGWAFVAGLVLALGGVVVLARSPAQASLAGDDGVARPPLKRL